MFRFCILFSLSLSVLGSYVLVLGFFWSYVFLLSRVCISLSSILDLSVLFKGIVDALHAV